MSLKLYHHPFSRAVTAIWMLEEVGQPYETVFVDLKAGEHHQDQHRARNRMGKLPVLQVDDSYISEGSAIGLYLADRFALGRLAPDLDDPRRGEYLRWCVFAASVIEPACMAKSSGWDYEPGQAGFGLYENMVATLDEGLAEGPYLLGEQFTMADVILGSTVRWMLQFKMIDRTQRIGDYAELIGKRPALERTNAVNARIAEANGVKFAAS